MKHIKLYNSKQEFIADKENLVFPWIAAHGIVKQDGKISASFIYGVLYDNQEEYEEDLEKTPEEIVETITKYEFNGTVYDSKDEAEQAVIDYYKVDKYHYDDNHFDSTSDVEDYIKEHASESDYVPSIDYTEEYYYPDANVYKTNTSEIVYTKSDEEIAQELWDNYKYDSYFRESGCGRYALSEDEFIEYCKNWKMNQCTVYDYNNTIYSSDTEFINAYKNDLSYENYYYYPNEDYYTNDSSEIVYTKSDNEIAKELWDNSSESKYFVNAGCGYTEVSSLDPGYYVNGNMLSESEFIEYAKNEYSEAQEMSDEDILFRFGTYKEPYEEKIYTNANGDICHSESDVLYYLTDNDKTNYIDNYREDAIYIDSNYYRGTIDDYASGNSSSWLSSYSVEGYYYNNDYFRYDDSSLDSYILSNFAYEYTRDIYTTSNGDICLSVYDVSNYLTDDDKSSYIDYNYRTVYNINGNYYDNISDYTDENRESWLNDYASSIVSSGSVYTCECIFNSNDELVWHEGTQESGYNDFMNNEISEIEVKA